jgi:hypothetical protein
MWYRPYCVYKNQPLAPIRGKPVQFTSSHPVSNDFMLFFLKVLSFSSCLFYLGSLLETLCAVLMVPMRVACPYNHVSYLTTRTISGIEYNLQMSSVCNFSDSPLNDSKCSRHTNFLVRKITIKIIRIQCEYKSVTLSTKNNIN